MIAEGVIKVKSIDTHENPADLLTKAITGDKTSKFATLMGLQNYILIILFLFTNVNELTVNKNNVK